MFTMSAVTFDTYKFVERLEKAGLPREQAAAIAEAQQQSLAEALDNTLATKTDIIRLESKMENSLQAMELRLTLRLGAIMATIVGIGVAILKMGH